jgi:hypothetical protein
VACPLGGWCFFRLGPAATRNNDWMNGTLRMCYGVPTGGIGCIRELAFDLRAEVHDDGVVKVIELATVARQLPAGTKCP